MIIDKEKMKTINSPIIRTLIVIISVINIAAMMGFEYGFPSLADSATNTVQEEKVQDETDVGTIESVEKEEENKETEAANTALAKAEKEEEDEIQEEVDPDAPILELTDDHIYLKVGERFNYMSYIETMTDVDGSDLSHYIYLDRDVDTSVPGDIELTYRITSTITGKSTSKVLLITVEE